MYVKVSGLESVDLGLSRLNSLAPMGYALGLHIRFASAHRLGFVPTRSSARA